MSVEYLKASVKFDHWHWGSHSHSEFVLPQPPQNSDMVHWSHSKALSCLSVPISLCKLFVYSATFSPAVKWLCAQSSNSSVIGRSSGSAPGSVYFLPGRVVLVTNGAWSPAPLAAGHHPAWALNWPMIALCNPGESKFPGSSYRSTLMNVVISDFGQLWNQSEPKSERLHVANDEGCKETKLCRASWTLGYCVKTSFKHF